MYILYFTVPESHLEEVKEAIFATGAGSVGAYSHCAWQVLGHGQFMPLPGAKPFIGEVSKLETVREYKVEIFAADNQIEAAVEALKRSHPYQTPSYQVVLSENF